MPGLLEGRLVRGPQLPLDRAECCASTVRGCCPPHPCRELPAQEQLHRPVQDCASQSRAGSRPCLWGHQAGPSCPFCPEHLTVPSLKHNFHPARVTAGRLVRLLPPSTGRAPVGTALPPGPHPPPLSRRSLPESSAECREPSAVPRVQCHGSQTPGASVLELHP